MASFLCAVAARDAMPRAFALVEQSAGAAAPSYTVRVLRALDAADPFADLLSAAAAGEQTAGHVRFVTTGGQKAADALRAHGPSASVVSVGPRAADAAGVSLQVLVDTFERLYRDGAVTVPGEIDAGAVAALYGAADLAAAAPDGDRGLDGDLDPALGADGPAPAVIEQSGSAAPLSTEIIQRPISPAEASAVAVAADVRVGRVAAATGGPEPDLGEHADTATALALAVWFGEASRDGLLPTDKADEASDDQASR